MIIVDTGFWLALANRNDRHHERATKALSKISENLVTTWPVMTETCHLLLNCLGNQAQTAFVESFCAGAFKVFEIKETAYPKIAELMNQYRNLPMDLADASLVIVAEELDSGRILSTDERDFKIYRWKNRKHFTNVLTEE